ncbi:hypothetical protein FRC02_004228 [Tulasnella sp. 418]|nr:hypothetical protein FRC02_004228 [Tulasnella sp. 418]
MPLRLTEDEGKVVRRHPLHLQATEYPIETLGSHWVAIGWLGMVVGKVVGKVTAVTQGTLSLEPNESSWLDIEIRARKGERFRARREYILPLKEQTERSLLLEVLRGWTRVGSRFNVISHVFHIETIHLFVWGSNIND